VTPAAVAQPLLHGALAPIRRLLDCAVYALPGLAAGSSGARTSRGAAGSSDARTSKGATGLGFRV
jgi:hypothetical protein